MTTRTKEKFFTKEGIKINWVIAFLTLSDVFLWGPIVVVNALVAVYLSQKLGENAVEMVGIGITIYYFFRALLQVPIGYLTDVIKKDRDEIFLLVFGTFLIGSVFFFYPFIKNEGQYYILQIFIGIGESLNLVTWRKLFAQNVTPDKEGVQYGIYETIISISTAAFGAIGGALASVNSVFFDYTMVATGFFIIIAGVMAAFVFKVEDRKSFK